MVAVAVYSTISEKGPNLKYKKHKITKEQILEANEQVRGINAISLKLETYPQVVRNICKEHNITLRDWRSRHNHNEVYMMYLDKGTKATADHYGYCIATVCGIVRAIRVKIYGPWRDPNKKRRRLNWDEVYEVRKTKSPSETAMHFNCTITAVRHIAKHYGIPPQTNGRSKSYDHKAIYKAHLKYGSPEAARLIGCCYNTVRHVVIETERKIAMSERDQPNGKN